MTAHNAASAATASPAGAAKTASNVAEFTVSQLSQAIKRTMEDRFAHVRLRGEISGYRGPHSSGHCYFTIKDEKARIDAIIWRGVFSRLQFRPEEGLEVIATGRVSTYPGSSKYQIVIEALEPAGVGALMALLEERKRKFAAEGLFDDARKRPLPFLPKVVGIVTSPTGAVIRDMLHGFDERFPTHVVLWPVRVQGETCAGEVARAIAGFNAGLGGIASGAAPPRPDVLIVARGGGSLEDLWGFNEEIVVRAVAASDIPVISAVGHETDWTLIDLVADARAPTPTKAAEWAVPKFSELVERVDELTLRLHSGFSRALERKRSQFIGAARGLPRLQDLVAMPRQRLDTASARLARALIANTQGLGGRHAAVAARLRPILLARRLDQARERVAMVSALASRALIAAATHHRARLERVTPGLRAPILARRLEEMHARLGELGERGRQAHIQGLKAKRRRLDGACQMLASLSYQSVLARGFALVRDGDGAAVRRAGAVSAGARLDIEFRDGHVQVEAIGPGRGRAGKRESERTAAEATRQSRKSGIVGVGKPSRTNEKSDKPGGQGSLF